MESTAAAGEGRRNRLFHVVAALLVALAIFRITDGYDVFNQTWDEPAHVVTGMEWLQNGTYDLEPLHPPLSRVAVALGPYLDGARLEAQDPPQSIFRHGTEILERGDYYRRLTLARIGVLPFFLLAAVAVWVWSFHLYGVGVATAAVLIFTSLPPVLAHAGLATTDVAFVAMLALALYAWESWAAAPSLQRALWVGAATALALLTKFSTIMFLPLSVGAIVGLRFASADGRGVMRQRGRGIVRDAAAAALVAGAIIWLGYRADIGSPLDADPRLLERIAAHYAPSPPPDLLVDLAKSKLLPAPDFFQGIKDVLYYSAIGRPSYLWGEVEPSGRWEFFPVALLVKTPIPVLILALAGTIAACGGARKRPERLAIVLIPLLIVLSVLSAKINIGVRHVLPVYVFLAVVAASGALWLARRGRWATGAAAALLVWAVIESMLWHPDYLAYVNQVSLLSDEPVLVDSDLDWGQDMQRLAATTRELGVDHLHMAYYGTAHAARRGLPPVTPLPPRTPVTGWVAISAHRLFAGTDADPQAYRWLRSHEPARLVGRSIYLYRITPAADSR